MEVCDGLIVGIYTYCDRWCETCGFTSYCRLFADVARMHALQDPGFKALAEAPPLGRDTTPPPPQWKRELIDEINEACAHPPSPEEVAAAEPTIRAEHQPLQARGEEYLKGVWAWLQAHDPAGCVAATDPRAVISWYHTLICVKMHRALTGLNDELWADEARRDCDGSAKVALLGIDRSLGAWKDAVEVGQATSEDAASFTGSLQWMRDRLEEVFPRARAFVRPGLDESEEVARLRAAEGL